MKAEGLSPNGTRAHASWIERIDWLSAYVAFLAVLAGGLLILLIHLEFAWQFPFRPWWALFFLLVALFADRYQLRVNHTTEVSAGFLANFLSGALISPVTSMAVAMLGIAAAYRRGEWQRNICFAAALGLASGGASLSYWGVRVLMAPAGTNAAWLLGEANASILVGGVVAGVVFEILNFAAFAPIVWLRHSQRPKDYWLQGFQPFLPFHFFFLSISLGLLYIIAIQGWIAFFLAFLPVLGLVYAFRQFAHVREQARRLEKLSLQMAASMVTALDMKDNYTAQHSAAVAQYSYDIAKAMNLDERLCNMAHLSGLLHDIGKISIPDDVLNSTERFDDYQLRLVRDHSAAGERILANVDEFHELGQVVLHHHEFYDGSGYPYRLAGEDIPQLSRIVSVADCYSAMISNRPYSAKRTPEWAMEELMSQRGKQFDPVATDVFLAILEQADAAYRTAEDVDFHVQFQKVKFLQDLA